MTTRLQAFRKPGWGEVPFQPLRLAQTPPASTQTPVREEDLDRAFQPKILGLPALPVMIGLAALGVVFIAAT
jgi:hypothetical protein